ncbi:hypothetical protein P23_1007 [Acinetobacter calcoaceticus]|jgi:hypothetical protein|uniref:hypothetical protein n=1 Tax=Acinetobacter calcoaceticus TaxID=471 RepID=UPI000583B906|nr:hypothetical protein [Acinetobacter calcoaceticus]GAM30504.1 hypothetical protein P23_1007 [Acinetobacter calcoaceticus]
MSNKPSLKETIHISILLLSFFSLSGFSYRLLFLDQIKSPEFVVLIIASMFICLIGYFLKEIQEFSIGGNLVKLKQAKDEVNEAIEQLKKFRIEAFRLFLLKAIEYPGGWARTGLKDERVESFIKLYTQIVNAKCDDDLREEIKKTNEQLLKDHLYELLKLDKELEKVFLNKDNPEPSQILLEINNEMLTKYEKRMAWTRCQVEAELSESISEYTALFNINKKYLN